MMRNKNLLTVTTTALLVCFVFAGTVQAAKKKKEAPVSTQKISEAGPDYMIQGEYAGTIESDPAPEMFGVQVIALGRGSFCAKGHHGGLPGAGWDKSKKLVFNGKRGDKKETAVLKMDGDPGYEMNIRNRKMTITDKTGKKVGELVRVVRKSPTLGKKPPEGALVLFDGKTAENFITRRQKKDAEMYEDKYLKLSRGTGGLFTKKAFNDCFLHLEFRLAFEPLRRGQGRSNSGCYMQGRYEVQILDSFGLQGRENECGGMYSSGSDPAVNMCFPPLTWQTYDIEFKAPEFNSEGKKTKDAWLTVYHNGVLIYRKQKIGHTTTASPVRTEVPKPLPHYLQDHGHTLVFKNVWVIER